jgi:hypothetical protein
MFRGLGIPLVQRQLLGAAHDLELFQRHAGHDGALTFTDRARTASEIRNSFFQLDFEYDRAAMARTSPNLTHCANSYANL